MGDRTQFAGGGAGSTLTLNPRVVSADDTIQNMDDIASNNTAAITLTVGADVEYFKVGRSTASTENVTIVPPAGFTIAGDATGVVINEAFGPIEFTLEGTDYIVEIPAAGSSSTGGSTSGTASTLNFAALITN